MLWDLNEGKHLYSLEAGDVVNALVFSPNRYWLCAATASCIKIFDLESKCVIDDVMPLLALIACVSSGRSSMSLSPTSARTRVRVCLSVSRSPGQQTVRPFLVGSRTTSSGCGPSSHKPTWTACILPYFAHPEKCTAHCWLGASGSGRVDYCMYARRDVCVFRALLHVAQNLSFALHTQCRFMSVSIVGHMKITLTAGQEVLLQLHSRCMYHRLPV